MTFRKLSEGNVADAISGSVYTGYSWGDHLWIDDSAEKKCTSDCRCRNEKEHLNADSFAFTVIKKGEGMIVRFHSLALQSEVLAVLHPRCQEVAGDGSRPVDGLVLLKRRDLLENRLRDLRSQQKFDTITTIAELTLLVEGFLMDHEIFFSFDYEKLYNEGYLSYQQWKDFQHSKLRSDIDALESSFYAIDEAENSRRHCQESDRSDSETAAFSSLEISGSENDTAEPRIDPRKGAFPLSPDVIFGSLNRAARNGNKGEVERLLNMGNNLNYTGHPISLGPPLVEAISHGHHDLAGFLLEQGADANFLCFDDRAKAHSPLLAAIRVRRSSMIRSLLAHGADVNFLDKISANEQWLAAKAILDHGFDPSLLLERVVNADLFDRRLLCVLVDGGANLAHAKKKKNADRTGKIIIDLNTLINYIESLRRRNTRLIEAVEQGQEGAIVELIKAGAEPTWGLLAAFQTENIHLLELLLDRGANSRFLNFNEASDSPLTAVKLDSMLVAAVNTSHGSVVRLLLSLGADINTVDPDTGQAPLIKAVRAGKHEICQILLESGASVDGIGNGETPLVVAATAYNSSMVSLLLRYGARYQCSGSNLEKETHVYQPTSDLSECLWDFHRDNLANFDFSHCPRPLGPKATEFSNSPRQKAHNSEIDLDVLRLEYRKSLEQELGCSPEHALFLAAAHGDYLRVHLILESALDFSIKSGQSAIPLVDLDHLWYDFDPTSWQGMTPLMVAIERRHQEIVESLLEHGADVNILTRQGTALSIAAMQYSEPIIRLLLRNRADLHVAVFALRSNIISTSQLQLLDPVLVLHDPLQAIECLNTVASQFRRQLNEEKAQTKEKLRQLYLEFLKEHALIVDATEKQTRTRNSAPLANLDLVDPCYSHELGAISNWAMNIERASRRAWATGVNVMRKLLRGELPETLNETIMFLAIVKAISTIKDSHEVSDHAAQFSNDLSRWQILFSTEDGNLEAFREAVNSIWRVVLENNENVFAPDCESLLKFQDMALSLVNESIHFFMFDDIENGALLSSQQRWRLRLGQSKMGSHGIDGVDVSRQFDGNMSNTSNDSDPNASFSSSPANLSEGEDSKGVPLRQSMRDDDWAFSRFNPLIVLLMAGAIFGILIAFLIGTINRPNHLPFSKVLAKIGLEVRFYRLQTHNETVPSDGPTQSDIQQPVIRDSLEHILSAPGPCTELPPEVLNDMKAHAKACIGLGLVSSFSSLTDLLVAYIQVCPSSISNLYLATKSASCH
jgi:ankyrin repeat protein